MLRLVVVVLERAWRAARWLVEIHLTHLTEKHGRAFNDGRLSPLGPHGLRGRVAMSARIVNQMVKNVRSNLLRRTCLHNYRGY